MVEPVRIAVGCAANNEDLESMLVLDFSIKKHTSLPVEITWMRLSRNPNSPFYSDHGVGWDTTNWATPFTGFRWAVPSLYRFKGTAAYFDSDFIILRDIAGLWQQEFTAGRTVIAKVIPGGARFCCSLWDCQHGFSLISLLNDSNVHARMSRVYEKSGNVQPYADGEWNMLDLQLPVPIRYDRINAIHYTAIDRQLQMKHAIPRLEREGGKHWYRGTIRPPREDLQKLFDDLLAEGLANGYHLDDYRSEPYGKYHLRGSK